KNRRQHNRQSTADGHVEHSSVLYHVRSPASSTSIGRGRYRSWKRISLIPKRKTSPFLSCTGRSICCPFKNVPLRELLSSRMNEPSSVRRIRIWTGSTPLAP